MSDLKSVEEAARYLNVASSTLNKWRVQGEGPRFAKIGGRVRYTPPDLEAYVAASLRRSTSEMPIVLDQI